MEARSSAANRLARDERIAVAAAIVLPATGFALLLAAPDLDLRWEHHPSHFWLVVFAAATTAALAYTTGEAADRRGDTRLYWASLSFLAAGGFLALHALATPEIFLEASNLGFQVAAPIGLVIAGVFAAASALDGTQTVHRPARRRVRAALVAFMLGWALATIAGVAPLDRVTEVERASGAITALALLGAAMFFFAAIRYLGLARRRRASLPLAVATGFFLLGEAILATAFARSWHASWWEWHLLILAGFGVVAWAARQEWREERFASLYSDETVRGEHEVSVVFADLAGFTSFSEGRNPVEVSEMLNAYFEVAIPPIVGEHGGAVVALAGDGIFAAFAERPGEPDHPLRAARAAIAIRDRSAEMAHRHPDWPRFRIGINTGEAMVGVLGAGAGRSYSVVGDVVNTGSRIEALAPVGEVAIGLATMQRLEGASMRRLGEIQVKGKSEPVEAFVLDGLGGHSPGR